ncbi:Uncharacterised protein [Vibrio cholerae]|nr:Uncharacterised protein [Vibrio cholerae]CSA05257.1 Uncharacterised protein [Vibrio cholerae]CSA28946.1 Uncharacterised protein [Vibrio cholerae]CSB22864.1 Uncharacterised protein [Vibrio cholerae]CSC27979.1 Uncharacterised protein [Vibrio cholerae]
MVKRLPRPNSESTSICPPSSSMLRLTTSIPTPRPEMSETCSAVENPGAKIKLMICLSVRSLRWV